MSHEVTITDDRANYSTYPLSVVAGANRTSNADERLKPDQEFFVSVASSTITCISETDEADYETSSEGPPRKTQENSRRLRGDSGHEDARPDDLRSDPRKRIESNRATQGSRPSTELEDVKGRSARNRNSHCKELGVGDRRNSLMRSESLPILKSASDGSTESKDSKPIGIALTSESSSACARKMKMIVALMSSETHRNDSAVDTSKIELSSREMRKRATEVELPVLENTSAELTSHRKELTCLETSNCDETRPRESTTGPEESLTKKFEGEIKPIEDVGSNAVVDDLIDIAENPYPSIKSFYIPPNPQDSKIVKSNEERALDRSSRQQQPRVTSDVSALLRIDGELGPLRNQLSEIIGKYRALGIATLSPGSSCCFLRRAETFSCGGNVGAPSAQLPTFPVVGKSRPYWSVERENYEIANDFSAPRERNGRTVRPIRSKASRASDLACARVHVISSDEEVHDVGEKRYYSHAVSPIPDFGLEKTGSMELSRLRDRFLFPFVREVEDDRTTRNSVLSLSRCQDSFVSEESRSQTGFRTEVQSDFRSGFHSEPRSGFQSEPRSGFQFEARSGFQPKFRSELESEPRSGFQFEAPSGFQPKFRSGFESEPQSGFQSEPRSGFRSNSRSGFQSVPQSGFQSEVESIFRHEFQPRFQSGYQPKFQPEMQPKLQSNVQSKFRFEFQPVFQPDLQPELQPSIQAEISPEFQSNFHPEFQPKLQSECQSEFQSKVQSGFQSNFQSNSEYEKGTSRLEHGNEESIKIPKSDEKVLIVPILFTNGIPEVSTAPIFNFVQSKPRKGVDRISTSRHRVIGPEPDYPKTTISSTSRCSKHFGSCASKTRTIESGCSGVRSIDQRLRTVSSKTSTSCESHGTLTRARTSSCAFDSRGSSRGRSRDASSKTDLSQGKQRRHDSAKSRRTVRREIRGMISSPDDFLCDT